MMEKKGKKKKKKKPQKNPKGNHPTHRNIHTHRLRGGEERRDGGWTVLMAHCPKEEKTQ